MNKLIISIFVYFSIFFLAACDINQDKKIDNTTNEKLSSISSADISSKHFSYDDFKEIKKPFHDTNCNYNELLKQNIELKFNNDYFYAYEKNKGNRESIDNLEQKEKCLILNSTDVTAYNDNIIIFKKKLGSVSKNDIDRNKVDGFDFTKKVSCKIGNEDDYGHPFIIEYRKTNNILSRNIVKNESFNFDCIFDKNIEKNKKEYHDHNRIILENNHKKTSFDFNQDGLIDKISLTKPADMDERNFNITINILKNTGNNYQKIIENTIMLEEPTSGCGLDGLQEIWGDGNSLNVIYQTCIDRKFATRNVSFAFNALSNDFILIKNEIEFSDIDGNSELHVCEVTGVDFSEFDGACY